MPIDRLPTGLRRRMVLGLAIASLPTLLPATASAQSAVTTLPGPGGWPAKPVRIMVGASAGGGTDVIARMLAERFAEQYKQSFVVENRPGASNTIAADITAKAPPDGLTLLVATNTGQAIAPHLLKLGFDPLKDLQPVGLIVEVPNVLLANLNLPVSSAAELVKLMKLKPEGFRYGSSGVGSTQHLAGAAFDLLAGTRSVHIPYKGSSQAHLDLIGGQIEIMFDTTSSSMPHIKSGKLKPLAVMSARRSPELPNVPTLAEAGYPGFEMSTWYGLFTTAGTPKPIVDALHVELRRTIALPEIRSKLAGLGGEPGTMTLEQFAEFNRVEYERFGKLIKDANVKTEK